MPQSYVATTSRYDELICCVDDLVGLQQKKKRKNNEMQIHITNTRLVHDQLSIGGLIDCQGRPVNKQLQRSEYTRLELIIPIAIALALIGVLTHVSNG